jgi:ribonuclease P protein component
MATFKKSERLHKKKEVAYLFDAAKSIHTNTIKLIYAYYPDSIEPEVLKALFVVPKRLFKKSPDRQLLKRRMREVYRLQKTSIKSQLNVKENQSLMIGFLYKYPSILNYQEIELDMTQLLNKLVEKLKG